MTNPPPASTATPPTPRLPPLDQLKTALALRDPQWWVVDRLGEFTWSKQREILASVRDNRRTAVRSCHSSGKSWLAARLACWWIESHPIGSAFVITTAPTTPQVKAILWREIRRAHVKGRLTGRLNLTEWWAKPVLPNGKRGKEEIIAFGRKPKDIAGDGDGTSVTAFQGVHARFVLVIMDEACGVPAPLWTAAESLITNTDSRFLAIGNPDDPNSEFYRVCSPGSGWHNIKIAADDTPNFTGELVPASLKHLLLSREWVDDKRRRWGENSGLYRAKVLAEFPESSVDSLIPMQWVRDAQQRTLTPSEPIELGMDVGGGGDHSVIACRRGPVVRIVSRDQIPDTMVTTGNLLAALETTGARIAKVDEIGIGAGVVDRAREIYGERGVARVDCPVVGINVGGRASSPKRVRLGDAPATERFINARAEAYWGLRERFQSGDIDLDPDDDDLVSQLVDIRYKRTSSGKIQIEAKADMKKRGRSSPDDADAVVLAFYRPVKSKPIQATWGSR